MSKRAVQDRIDTDEKKRQVTPSFRFYVGCDQRGGGFHLGKPHQGRHQRFGNRASRTDDHPVRSPGHGVHALDKGMKRCADGDPNAGEYGGAHGDARHDGQGAPPVVFQVPKAEPHKKPD
jgi:hypothetical protein